MLAGDALEDVQVYFHGLHGASSFHFIFAIIDQPSGRISGNGWFYLAPAVDAMNSVSNEPVIRTAATRLLSMIYKKRKLADFKGHDDSRASPNGRYF